MKDKSFQKAFEQIEIPKEELRSSIQKGIQKGATKGGKKKVFYKYSTAAAILTVTMMATLLFSFPSYAQKLPVIKNVFELFMENETDEHLENYARYTTKLGVTAESNGVRMTFTEGVYDGVNVTVAYTLESEHDFGDQPFVVWDLDQANLSGVSGGRQIAKKTGENEYGGLFIFDVKEGNSEDSFQLKWEGKRIGHYDMANDPHTMLNPIEGSWNFDIVLENVGSVTERFTDLVSENAGVAVSLKEMTTTPISTSLYFTERIDSEIQDELYEEVIFNYEVSDDLGNSYSVVSNGSWGNDERAMTGQITMTSIDQEASFITITPIVNLLKEKEEQKNDNDGLELELLQEPFELETITVPLNGLDK